MTYSEIKQIVRNGKVGLLPHFIGFFKWDYVNDDMKFVNDGFTCKASDLDILNRDDFFYIT